MKIGRIIKELQPEVFYKLNRKLTYRDMIMLMGTRSYKRARGGAIKQIRY